LCNLYILCTFYQNFSRLDSICTICIHPPRRTALRCELVLVHKMHKNALNAVYVPKVYEMHPCILEMTAPFIQASERRHAPLLQPPETRPEPDQSIAVDTFDSLDTIRLNQLPVSICFHVASMSKIPQFKQFACSCTASALRQQSNNVCRLYMMQIYFMKNYAKLEFMNFFCISSYKGL
jgi:hypothetical protein